MIKLDFNLNEEIYNKYLPMLNQINDNFNKNGKMKDWSNIDTCITKEDINRIKEETLYIKNNADVFIVIGIGGSFLGSKALISALQKENTPKIVFAGTTLETKSLQEVINYVKNNSVVINVISKSGSTLETNIVFNVLLEEMKKKYSNDELSQRIIITTDNESSTLLKVKEELNCKLFNVQKDIGGRFSVLTNVGLLPTSVAGINIDELLRGASEATLNETDIYKYTTIRDICYRNNKFIEAFTTYQESLEYFNEWLKQLFAESQGKDKKGILPISIINTRDLHSLGQYLDDGKDFIFETIIYGHEKETPYIKEYDKRLDDINYLAMQSVTKAHKHMVNNIIELDEINEYNLGYLIYFFEKSCMLGAYLLSVNYYDQEGVQNYKKILLSELNK